MIGIAIVMEPQMTSNTTVFAVHIVDRSTSEPLNELTTMLGNNLQQGGMLYQQLKNQVGPRFTINCIG